jgi:hypothetical protein
LLNRTPYNVCPSFASTVSTVSDIINFHSYLLFRDNGTQTYRSQS